VFIFGTYLHGQHLPVALFSRRQWYSSSNNTILIADEYENFLKAREDLIELGEKTHFSNGIKLTPKEQIASKKLNAIRESLFKQDDTVVTGPYYEKSEILKKSALYGLLDMMPKPVLHHIHLTAASNVEFLVKTLCYLDIVYFSEKDEMFKVTKKPEKVPEGYIKVNDLRKFWKSSTEFDKYLENTILLKAGVETQEHHEIWKYFQPKFMLTYELYNFDDCFERLLEFVCEALVQQNVMVIEWKHIFGMVINDDGPVSLKQEIDIFHRVSKKMQVRYPLF